MVLSGLALASTFAVAVIAFAGFYMLCSTRMVAENELLHEHVPASSRATMVSAQSLSQQTGGVIASLGLTRVAATAGIPVAWGIGAALLLPAAALLLLVRPHPRRSQDGHVMGAGRGTRGQGRPPARAGATETAHGDGYTSRR